MNQIIKITKIFAAAALIVLGMLLVACQTVGGSAPDAIYFEKGSAPRNTYVQGQELDFSNSVLTTEAKGATETVPMDSSDVTVSGYNKDTLGEQTVTVTYKGLTTTFKVTVIPRITVEGYDMNYFVGDQFNKQNGRVKVADDKATVTTLNMKEDAVVITNFDSATPGTKTVTVICNGYSGSFTVNILDVQSVKFSSPSKKSYQSHETDFNAAGGYFTVTSEGGTIQKTVPVSADMVKGFDPSAATLENRTASTALKQKITIEYLGHMYEMEISIRYSGVSIMKQRANEMSKVDVNAAINETIGKNAMDAINEYFDLSVSDQELITAEERDTVARIAAIYAYTCFVKETEKYSHTFALNAGESTDQNGKLVEYCGYFSIGCDKYENMVLTLEALRNDESEFNVLADFLHDMEEELPDLVVLSDKKIDQYFETLFLKDDLPYVTDLFKQMVAIYKALEVVPENWDREMIKDAAMVEGIEDAYARITTSNFYFLNYPEFYAMISKWRTKNDFYEIIHSHYLYNKTYGENESYATAVWEKIPFPGEVQTLYDYIASGYSETAHMQKNVYDTTYFMMFYRNALKLSEQIQKNENKLYGDVYEAIGFAGLVDEYLYSASKTNLYGYINVVGTLLYNKDVLDLFWNDYFALVDLSSEDGTLDFENADVALAVEKMFNDFFSLSAFERHQIISTLYSNYRNLNIDGYAFDFSKGTTGTFINILSFYYAGENGVLPKSTHDLFQKLMIATEQYGIRYKHLTTALTAVSEYNKQMEEIVKLYKALSPEDQAIFDRYVGAAYTANLKMYQEAQETAPTLQTYPLLEEFKAVLDSYYAILEAIAADSEAANTAGTYALLFMAYEKANALRAEILASNNQDMIDAFRYYDYMTLNENDENENNNYKLTLEAVFDLIKGSAHGYTLTITNGDGSKISHNAIEYYTKGGLAEFLRDSYKVIYTNFKGGLNNKEDVLALMEKYRALDKDAVVLFYSLNVDASYYAAIEAFFASALSEDAATASLATALIAAEKAYAEYLLDPEKAEVLDRFKTAWETAVTEQGKLGEATGNYDALLKGMYEYYLAKYTALTANA